MLYKPVENRLRSTFRQTSLELDQFYRLDFSPIEAWMRKRFPRSYDRRIQRNVRLLRHIVDELAKHYVKPPVRQWPDLSENQQRVLRETIYPRWNADALMRRVHASLIHQRTVVVVWLRDERGIHPHALLPYEVEVDPHPLRWWDIQSASEVRCRIPISSDYETTVFSELVMTPDRIELTGTMIDTRVLGYDGQTARRTIPSSRPGVWDINGKDTRNPFKGSPITYPAFVVRIDDPPTGDFFCPLPGDLHMAQIASVVDMSALLTAASDQSYGLRYASGASKDQVEEMEMSTDVIGVFPENATLNQITPTPATDQFRNALNAYVDLTAITNNMSPADFRKDSAITALAKQVAENDRAVARDMIEPILLRAEQDLYDTWRACDMMLDPENLFPESKVAVSYTLPSYPFDPQNQAVADKFNMEMGLTTSAELLAARKGISLDDARARVRANLEENRANRSEGFDRQEVGPDPSGAVSARSEGIRGRGEGVEAEGLSTR